MRHGALFNGIGGFQLAAEWIGWENVFSSEIDEFCNRVTKYHFPNCIQHGDIKTTDFSIYRGKIDIITGGFPCQPFSQAGKRKGTADDRHLWPEMLRAIREIQPLWVVGENVRGIINWNGGLVFDKVQTDLEVEGYEIQAFLLPACAVDAPHRRDRIWFVAYGNSTPTEHKIQTGGNLLASESQHESPSDSNSDGCNGGNSKYEINTNQGGVNALNDIESLYPSSHTNKCIRQERGMHQTRPETAERHLSAFDSRNNGRDWENFPTQSPICDRDDGISDRLDGITFSKWRNESIKALGNAIVPK